MTPLTQTLKVYSMSVRSAVEHCVLSIMAGAKFNEEACIQTAQEEIDGLWGAFMENSATRINEEGSCTYCDNPVDGNPPQAAVSPCDMLAEDLNISTLVLDGLRYKFEIARLLLHPKAKHAHLAHVSLMVQTTGDYSGGYTALLILKDEWEGMAPDTEYRLSPDGKTSFKYIPYEEVVKRASEAMRGDDDAEIDDELWEHIREMIERMRENLDDDQDGED